GTLTLTQGDMGGNVLVLYIQAGTATGFADTSGFNDTSDGIHQAISGVQAGNPGNRSVLTFLSGFTPNYALGIQLGNFAGLYGLANGSSLNYLGSLNLTPSSGSGSGTYTFSFNLA